MDLSTSYTIKAQVQGQNQIGGLQKSLGGLKTTTNNTATAMTKLKTAAGNALGVLKNLAPAIGVAGLGKLVNDTLQLGDQLEKMSQKTGLAVPVLDKLRQAANLGGTEFKTLSRALPTLAKNMQDASDGVGTAKEAFDRLGLGVTNADGSLKSLDTMFFEIGDKIKNMDDRTLAAANAAELFGTGMGAKLIPIMNQGSEAIQNLSTGFTQLSAERMAKFNDNVAQMGEKFNVLKVQLTEALLPILSKLVDIISAGAKRFAALPGPVKAISVAFALLLPTIGVVVPLLATMVISFKAIAAVKLSLVIGKITTSFSLLLPAVKGALAAFAPLLAGAAIPAAIIALGVLIFKFRDQIGEAFKKVGEFIQNFFSPLTNFIGNVFNGAMDLARNAFNRLPNIVQEAIKFATAPLRGFIKFVEKILSLLGRVKGSKIEAPKTAVSSSTAPSTSNTSYSSGFSTASSNVRSTNIPKTNNFTSSLNNTTTAPLSNTTTAPRSTSTSSIPRNNSNPIVTTQLPSGGYSITNVGTGKPKPPNINIQTGNVVQMDNTNYVTTKQLQNAVQSATTQTMNYIQAGGVTYYLP